MATVKKYQKGGVVSTVKKAAAKAVETVKKSAPKSNPFKNVADLSKTPGQRFLSKDKVEMKHGGKLHKAQDGKSVKKVSKPTGMNFDKKQFDSLMKTKNYDSLIKTKAKAKSGMSMMKKGGKMKKAC
jgi:hypothetical protein